MAGTGEDRRKRQMPPVGFGRLVILLVLLGLMVAVLTSAQISHAYLTATGGAGGVSAIAIRDDARRLEEQADTRGSLQDELLDLRARQSELQAAIGDAAMLTYLQKVKFRRFIFACYPDSMTPNTAAPRPVTGEAVSELSWDRLLTVYSAASRASPRPDCSPPVDQPIPTTAPLTARIVTPDDHFRPCSVQEQTATGREQQKRLECLWDNVTAGVGLTSSAEQMLAAIDGEIVNRSAQLAQIDGSLSAYGVFTDAAGRSAVAAWSELNGGGHRDGDRDDRDGSRTPQPQRQSWDPGRLIAWAVTTPLLVQSVFLAMAAGAVGGGLAWLWEALGYRRLSGRRLEQKLETLSSALAVANTDKTDIALRRQLSKVTKDLTAISDAVLEHAVDERASMLTASSSGAGSALVLWLLTTSGLFVLSGGDNALSASPNVLLAISLAAGLAHREVIDRIFTMTREVVGQPDDDDDQQAQAQG